MMNPIQTYTGGGLQPVYGVEGVSQDVVVLANSKAYAQGQLIGQVTGSGTAVNEVQTLTPGAALTAGSYQLVYDNEYTTPLAFNATIAQIQAALEALPSIGVGGCTVTGGPLNTTLTTFTFAGVGTTAGQRMATLATVSIAIVGGPLPATATVLTPGNPAAGYWDVYTPGASGAFAGLATAKRALRYPVRTDGQGHHYFGTDPRAGDFNHFDLGAPAFLAGTFKAPELIGLDANALTNLGARFITGSIATIADPKTLVRIS